MIGHLYRWRGEVWRVLARGEPFDRGPRRNVLLQRVVLFGAVAGHPNSGMWLPTDERVVRPFRGLRCYPPRAARTPARAAERT